MKDTTTPKREYTEVSLIRNPIIVTVNLIYILLDQFKAFLKFLYRHYYILIILLCYLVSNLIEGPYTTVNIAIKPVYFEI